MKNRVPTIRADVWPLGRPAAFRTIEDALAQSDQLPRHRQSLADGRRLVGLALKDYWYTRKEVGLVLGSSMALRVWVGCSDIEWIVAPISEFIRPAPDEVGPVCRMLWPNGTSSLWFREELLRKKLDRSVTRFAAGEKVVWVHFEGTLKLLLNAVTDKDHGDIMLFWSEDD